MKICTLLENYFDIGTSIQRKSLTYFFTILCCWMVNATALAKDVLKSSAYSTPSFLRELKLQCHCLFQHKSGCKNTDSLLLFCVMHELRGGCWEEVTTGDMP